MKKIGITVLFLISIFLLTPNKTLAKSTTAQLLTSFDSTKSEAYFAAKITKELNWIGKNKLEQGSVIEGKIVEIVPPQKGKRNAYFCIKPISYTIPSQDNKKVKINSDTKIKIKEYIPTNKTEIAGKVATVAAGTVIKGIGLGVNFVEGAIKTPEGENRLKSGAKNVYDNSPLSYIETGHHINLKENELVKFSISRDIFK